MRPFVECTPRADLPATSLIAAAGSTATPITAKSTIFLWTGLIDNQAASAELRTIERRNGFLRLICRGHFDEGKAPRLARECIRDDLCRLMNAAIGDKEITQVLFCGGIRKTPTYSLELTAPSLLTGQAVL